MTDVIIVIVGLLFLGLLIAIANLRIVPQSKAYVMERLGIYSRTWYTGLHIKIPFIERAAKIIDLKEQVADYPPQPVITKDNVRMQIDTVVFYQITDCKLFAYGHAKPLEAIEHLTATTLRNIIGELELDTTLTSRDLINSRMRAILDEATDAWGIKVNRVELKNIIPPKEIQDAMERQMKAERERREAIIRAEGERKSTILVAEGYKQAAILKAEGDKQARILAAEAEREAEICRGEGEAEYILQVQQATAEGIKMVNASEPSKEVLAIKSLEAFEKAADGQATKIIIPSEIQGLAGLASSANEIFKA
ncbi:MAG: SPFH domain-containing protein [Eubacteriales bacterium]